MSSLLERRDELYSEISTGNKPSSHSSHHHYQGLHSSQGSSQGSKCDDENSKNDDYEKESKLAASIADALKNNLCYDEIGGDWYSEKGGLWSITTEKKALKVIMSVLDKKQPDGYAISKLNNIKSFLMIYLLVDEWNCSRHLLPVSNGVLDTKNMTLIKYSHEHRFNWQLPYEFDKKAEIKVIDDWLKESSNNDCESINIIRAFFKIALVGGEIQKFLELIGVGGTGKSTLARLLVALLGERNSVTTDLKQLEQNKFEVAGLYGKRLALINDSSRYGGEVNILKSITGGDPVRMEKKNQQQSGSFVYEGVVMIVANEAIQTADYTSGLIRRRTPVNFNRKVTDADRLKWKSHGGLETAMQKELSGLLNWALSMSDDDVRTSLGGINGEMTQVQREHLVETNKIAAWIDDNLVISPDAKLYVGASIKKKTDKYEIDSAISEKLYANYENWCEDNAIHHPVGLQRFTGNVIDVCGQLKIEVKGLDKDRTGKRIQGLDIRKDSHFKYITPVTKKLLCDDKSIYCDDDVTKGSLGGDDVTKGDDKNSVVTNTSLFDSEVF